MFYLGFDIGGSSTKAVLAENQKIIKSWVADTPKNLESLLELIKKIKEELVSGKEIAGVGIALAGTLDLKREKMLQSPNLSFLNNQPVKELFKKTFEPWPVKIEHDVHCFLLAEKKIGLAQNLKSVFYLTLGTGIGGAWMINGKIIFGAHGAAGEAGHMVMEKNAGLDLEDLASNKLILKSLGAGSIEAEKRARQGDQKAREVLEKIGENLGTGIANIINIFDPEAVILNGGICSAKEFIQAGIERGIGQYVISPAAQETKILFSALGREAGALGAALLFEED